MSKYFEHINFDQRKIIANKLSTVKPTTKDLGELLNLDPTSISKEIRRNRIIHRKESKHINDSICRKTLRFPYVCNGCSLKRNCRHRIYIYEASSAQKSSDYRLVSSRMGINLSQDEFEILDKKIKDGIILGKSVYSIVMSDDDIKVTVPTVYRYINHNLLSTSRSDLPYSPKLKKRKYKKEYEYSENRKIDRNKRTYIDYLSYILSKPNIFIAQMDFLGSIKTDSKSILTLTIPNLHFVMLFLFNKKDSSKIVTLFNKLEEHLGLVDFKRLFPLILTDRDPCFSDFIGMEFSHFTGEERTRVFYCDAYKSNQKGNVENMNKQLRRFFPKKSSIDNTSEAFLLEVMDKLNSNNLSSLNGSSPKEAFIRLYGEELYRKIISFKYSDK